MAVVSRFPLRVGVGGGGGQIAMQSEVLFHSAVPL